MVSAIGLLVLAVASGATCGSGDLVRSERDKLARSGEFAFYWAGCRVSHGEAAAAALPFDDSVLVNRMRAALRGYGVPLVEGRQMENARPLNFAACVWKTGEGYRYAVNVAPAAWRTDPKVEIEEVGVWFLELGRAAEAELEATLLLEVERVAARFACEYRKARASVGARSGGGRTRR